MFENTTICAIASPAGSGAISLIRLSGNEAFIICERVFIPHKKSKKISCEKSFTVHFGTIVENENIIDEVLVSIYKSPNSYTGEDLIEISCHGSYYIQQKIVQTLINKGATLAKAGEFTMRAFMNGKMDLSQAEAVADVIASTSAYSHRLAMQQMRGGVSEEIKKLREQLVNFISLIELELDFSEEDMEFADRNQLKTLINHILQVIKHLSETFEIGNAIKNGVGVAIVGEPNVGKSTLLNVLLNDEKAIVSEIAGTTRDAIEDTIHIDGILFRFIDTAGLRHTTDVVEQLGIERTYQKINQANIVLLLVDIQDNTEIITKKIDDIKSRIIEKTKIILIQNKLDKHQQNADNQTFENIPTIQVSAKEKININLLKNKLLEIIQLSNSNTNDVIISNTRHYEALTQAGIALQKVLQGMEQNISGEFISLDIRDAINSLGEITGEITNNEVLGNIFAKFCIGK